MKKISLIIAQDLKELKFILKKVNLNENSKCLPLSLDTLLYCDLNKIPYINPSSFLDNKIHKDGLVACEKLIKKYKEKNFYSETIFHYFIHQLRYYFNSCFFILSLIDILEKKISINHLFVSGWNSTDISPPNNYIISNIVEHLYYKKTIKIDNQKSVLDDFKSFEYYYPKNLTLKSNSYLFTNFGYNFRRLVFFLLKNNKRIVLLSFQDISFLKKVIFKLLRINLVLVQRMKSRQKQKINFPKIKFLYKNKNISNLLETRSNIMKPHLINLINKCNFFDKFYDKFRPTTTLLNFIYGAERHGAYLAKKLKLNSFLISHGTVAKSFNKFDKIYKKNIAHNVFSGNATHYAIQTKIASNSLGTHKIKGKPLNTGNLIFSESISNKNSNNIVYAVTMKRYTSTTFYGVEMYYEFYENLKSFDEFFKKSKFNLIVKLPPKFSDLKKHLKIKFKNLSFSNKKIDDVIENSFACISYSSTVIEDSLCCKKPVVLFDKWKRYKHCNACTKTTKINEPIYYANNLKKLEQSIISIKKSKNINFDKVLFHPGYKKNLEKTFQNFKN